MKKIFSCVKYTSGFATPLNPIIEFRILANLKFEHVSMVSYKTSPMVGDKKTVISHRHLGSKQLAHHFFKPTQTSLVPIVLVHVGGMVRG
jgi:hypothetical protein